MKKTKMRKALREATGCTIQHTGYPCGTCFFALSEELTNQDWQALLLFRGDYKRENLDNLPDDVEQSLDNIYTLATEKITVK